MLPRKLNDSELPRKDLLTASDLRNLIRELMSIWIVIKTHRPYAFPVTLVRKEV